MVMAYDQPAQHLSLEPRLSARACALLDRPGPRDVPALRFTVETTARDVPAKAQRIAPAEAATLLRERFGLAPRASDRSLRGCMAWCDRMIRNANLKGALLMTASMGSFTLNDVFVKLLARTCRCSRSCSCAGSDHRC
jgi:hypothetical protein